ncbi:hypothetical protein [Nocardiopsis ganjiahuensis]|uniref:hypothetical protein n=1 Tax=Nocardiopsis ganjiahuensis TaxID=239984 RepID=UPI000381FDE7|nr:hypothetical protein [Nocardiopsis ganjiahuensis]
MHPTFVVDVHSRRVAGRRVSGSPRTGLAPGALEMVVWNRSHGGRRNDGLVHHSEKGVRHLAVRCTQRSAEAKVFHDLKTALGLARHP